MYRLLILSCLLHFSGLLNAQLDTDSLINLSRSLPNAAEQLAFLDGQVTGKKYSDFTVPILLFQERVNLAKQQEDFQNEVFLTLDLIRSANYSGAYGLADSLSLHYATEADRIERPRIKAEVYFEAGKAAFFGRDYAQNIHYDTTALAFLAASGPPAATDSLRVEILNYLGKGYNASGQFVPAALTLQEAVELYSEIQPKKELLRELYVELGIVYSQIGLYDQAVDYLDRTNSIGLENTPYRLAQSQTNIGRNLLLTRKYKKALSRYRSILRYQLNPVQRMQMRPYAYNGIIEAHYRMGNTDSINQYFAAYDQLVQDNQDRPEVNNFLYQQSLFLHQLVNGQLRQAQATGDALYQDAIVKNDPAERLMYTDYLSDLYRRQGDYRRAEAFTRENKILQDSIQSANRTNALLLYYNQFETQEKENQILRLDQEREQSEARRRLFQTVAGFLAALLLIGGILLWQLRKARRKLAFQNEELSALNRTKDRFFSIIAHDLRNPIVALETADTQVSALISRGKTEAVQKVVGHISQTAGRLSGLLDNLLQWSLGQSGAITLHRQELDLAQIVQENTELYAPAATNKGITLLAKIDPGTSVRADKNALRTILRNLLGNAVKFTPAHQEKSIRVMHRKEGKFDVITVVDEGPGIAAAEQKQLFRLHGEDEKRKQGTGLGLILCKELAELHGGRIGLESEVGQGTTFSIWLPRG